MHLLRSDDQLDMALWAAADQQAFSAQVIKHESVYPDTAILSIAGLTIPPDFAGGTDTTCDEEAATGNDQATSDVSNMRLRRGEAVVCDADYQDPAGNARNPHPHSGLWNPLASGEVHTVLIPAGASDQSFVRCCPFRHASHQ